mgnify:CR=1 FL=1
MKRWSFLKQSARAIGFDAMLPIAENAAEPTNSLGERLADK